MTKTNYSDARTQKRKNQETNETYVRESAPKGASHMNSHKMGKSGGKKILSKLDIEHALLQDVNAKINTPGNEVETTTIIVDGKKVVVPLRKQRAQNVPYSSRVEKPHHGLQLGINENLALYDFHRHYFVSEKNSYGRTVRKEVMSFLQFKIFYMIRYSPGRHKPKYVEYPKDNWFGQEYSPDTLKMEPTFHHRLCVHPRELLSDYNKYYHTPPTPHDLLNQVTRQRYTLLVRDYCYVKKTGQVIRGCNTLKSIDKEIEVLDIRHRGEEDYETRRSVLLLEKDRYLRRKENLAKGLTAEGKEVRIQLVKPVDFAEATAKIGVQKKKHTKLEDDIAATIKEAAARHDKNMLNPEYATKFLYRKSDEIDREEQDMLSDMWRESRRNKTLLITEEPIVKIEGSVNYVVRSGFHPAPHHLDPGPWLPEYVFSISDGEDSITDESVCFYDDYPRFDFCDEPVWSHRILTPFYDRGIYPVARARPVFMIIASSYWQADDDDDDQYYDLQAHRRLYYFVLTFIAVHDPLIVGDLNGNNGSATNTDDHDTGRIYTSELGIPTCPKGNACLSKTHWHRLRKPQKALTGAARRHAEKEKLCKEITECMFSLEVCTQRGEEADHYHVSDRQRKDQIRSDDIDDEEVYHTPVPQLLEDYKRLVANGRAPLEVTNVPEYAVPKRTPIIANKKAIQSVSEIDITKRRDISRKLSEERKLRSAIFKSVSNIDGRDNNIADAPSTNVNHDSMPAPVSCLDHEESVVMFDDDVVVRGFTLTDVPSNTNFINPHQYPFDYINDCIHAFLSSDGAKGLVSRNKPLHKFAGIILGKWKNIVKMQSHVRRSVRQHVYRRSRDTVVVALPMMGAQLPLVVVNAMPVPPQFAHVGAPLQPLVHALHAVVMQQLVQQANQAPPPVVPPVAPPAIVAPAIPPQIVFQLNQAPPPPVPPPPPAVLNVVLPQHATTSQVDILMQKEVIDWAAYYWSQSYREGAVSDMLIAFFTRLFSFCQFTTNRLPEQTAQITNREMFTRTEMSTYIPIISEFFGRWNENMDVMTDLTTGAYNHCSRAIIFNELHAHLLQKCGEVQVAGINSKCINPWLFSRIMNVVPLYSREYFDPQHYQRTMYTIVYTVNTLVMNHALKVNACPYGFSKEYNGSYAYIRGARGRYTRGGLVANSRPSNSLNM